jgi:hypothetical protein
VPEFAHCAVDVCAVTFQMLGIVDRVRSSFRNQLGQSLLAIEQRRLADIIAVVFEQFESDQCGFLVVFSGEEAYLPQQNISGRQNVH